MTVFKTCPWSGCGRATEMEADAAALRAWSSGVLIQVAFPHLTPRERETLKTGYCAEHMTLVFGPERTPA